ncbi:hypothetical protein [Phormidium sp. CCY1219]|nr:hypothetical protein [Phormidium sp. CCY1219]MEB3826201.1 hypothetical protein [Phormidium sp. CCY1219]
MSIVYQQFGQVRGTTKKGDRAIAAAGWGAMGYDVTIADLMLEAIAFHV